MSILVPGSLLSAQTNPEKQLVRAFTVEREGKAAQAIATVQTLLDSKSLNAPGTGKAWNILALAYQDQGSFALAQHAYEQSIDLLERLPDNIKDYAMVLDDFGGLYLAMGDPRTAAKIKIKALHLYEKIDDHTGMAIASSDLAGLALSQKRVRDGRKYLGQSLKEVLLPNTLDSDNLAAISSMQGWLAQMDGDVSLAVTRYQASFDLWRKGHGEEHPSTGWGYILLGNAKAGAGALVSAAADMQRGLDILDRTLGRQNPRYMTAEIAYSRVLDRTEAHAEANRMRTGAEEELKEFYRGQYVRCTTGAAAFR
jgi:tetratricopeptide (TPR) repeat protein